MNEKRFDGKAEFYSSARPNYPNKLLRFLEKRNFIDCCSIVADIGSGTGIFSKQLADIVSLVYAVEPNSDMRRNAEENFGNISNIVSVDGNAENTLLSPNSVDCVTVAQAFHWFDREKFKNECKRILKSDDGTVLLIWNDRDNRSEIIRENNRINTLFCPNFKGTASGICFEPSSFDDFFCGGCEYCEFENVMRYNKEAFIHRNLSSSYAPKINDEKYYEYIKKLEKLFDETRKNDIIEYPYLTRCYIGKI